MGQKEGAYQDMSKVTSFICGLAAVTLWLAGSAVAADPNPPGDSKAAKESPRFAPSLAQAGPSDSDDFTDYVSELRFGILDHDPSLFGDTKESGVDINLEALFHSPESFKYILSPRPHLGASINTVGDTSQFYFGLTWGLDIGPVFAEVSFGGSANNGEYDIDPNRESKELGCPLNFRSSGSIGYRFLEHHSLSVIVDHISNASLCSENEGLETLGIRYGYKF
jgi:lipid A 3-O-deacylase